MRKRVGIRLLVVGLGALAAIGLGAPAALAEDPEAQEVLGKLLDNERQPVAGVTIVVTGAEGFSGEATTESDGAWAVAVPGPGPYQVELDSDTLPSGVAEPIRNPIDTTVSPGADRPVQFVLGERDRNVQTFWDRAAQLTVEGFRFGLIIAMGAVGLSLIYGTTGLTNFAHGELITFGALAAYYLNVSAEIPFIWAGILAVLLSAGFGWLNDAGLWKPLRKRGTGLIAMMIVSIGLALALRTIFLIIFGGTSRPFAEYTAQAGWEIGPVSVTPVAAVSMVLAVVVLVLAGLALLKTRMGKATRAVSDNPALAAASGIDVQKVIRIVWVAGAALAGLGGIFLAFTQQVNVTIGQNVLLLIFAAVTLGGLGTAYGALVGSLVVGMFISLSTLWIPSELKNVGALAVLIVILLVKPSGLLGRRSRVG